MYKYFWLILINRNSKYNTSIIIFFLVFYHSVAIGDNDLKEIVYSYETDTCVSRCHVNFMAYRTEHQGDVFLHGNHSPDQGLECHQCHKDDVVGTDGHGELLISNKDCRVCHHKDPKQKDCLKCHAEIQNYINGEIRNSNINLPDWMYKAVSCIDCHEFIHNVASFKSVRENCIECHNHHYGLLYDKWKETLEKEIKQCLRTKINNSGKISLLDFIQSHGLHNYRLSRKLIKLHQNQ